LKDSPNILFISAFRAPFIQEDLDALSRRYRVHPLVGSGVGQLVPIVLGVLRADIVFCWFASVYGAIGVIAARLLGRKSVIVLGGVDIAKDERLGYGIWLSWWRSKLVRYALLKANRVLVSDLSMKKAATRLAEYTGGNITYVPPGFDLDFWKPGGDKDPHILTVAAVRDEGTMLRKGIDVLIESARRLPQFTFSVVGADARFVFDLNPPQNMTFRAVVAREELLPFYRSAKVYCQPSVIEALCYTLREAMLCGCIPVASNVGGMTTAVSGIGLLVPPANVGALVAALLKAMQMPDEVGAKARARMVALYPREKREAELQRIIEGFAS
jgi:glycosyltransferase involved in cell wall biosynthesis